MKNKEHDFSKYGVNFKIIIEAKNNGIHFMLAKTLTNLGDSYFFTKNLLFDNPLIVEEEIDHLLVKGQYYLFWGPKGDSKLEYHGISPLRSPKNNPWKFQGATTEFFKAVKNAPETNFNFKSPKNKIKLNEKKYPNGRLY